MIALLLLLAIATPQILIDTLPPLPDTNGDFEPEVLRKIVEKSVTLPTEYDPRTLTPTCLPTIMNQGACGSCYAFATAFCFSARLCKATNGAVTAFAPNTQELVTCDGYNGGCDGGDASLSFRYISMYGIGPSSCKTYNTSAATTANLGACTINTCTDGTVTSTKYYCKNGSPTYFRRFSLDGVDVTEDVIKSEIYNNGPVVTSIISYDSTSNFSHYTTADAANIYSSASSNESASTDHAVSLIGWGSNYWIIANSWGANWGYQGFAKIAKGIRKIATNIMFCSPLTQ